MKSCFTFLLTVLACTIANAQNINDVLRYSNQNIQGTARFQGLSGAFGALGGDLSALNVNPAGSAVFNNSQFTASVTNYNRNNKVLYANTSKITDFNSLDINQLGGVFVFKSSDSNSSWKKIALAFNYDISESFENEFELSGTTSDGVDTYFLALADGIQLQDISTPNNVFTENYYLDLGINNGFETQQAFLGFQSFLFDPETDINTNNIYISNAGYTNVRQNFLQTTSGYNSKFTLNLSGQYEDNLYLGAALNFHAVSFDKITQLRETGYEVDSPIQYVEFDNFLHTDGGGFSFSLGAISKINDNIRIGGSYQSPTWYLLTDETSQRIETNTSEDERRNGNSDVHFINFDVVNIFNEYTIKTPSKLTGSLAVIFGKDGLLSFDYGYQDMSKAELRPTSDAAFQDENNFIANELTAVSTYRLGGEYRIKQISLRGGYRFEQSPYANENTIGNLEGYSAGIGYNFGNSRLDLAANRTEQDINDQLFDTGLSSSAFINSINTNVTLSYTVNF